MLDIFITEDKKIDILSIKNKEKSFEDIFFGKIVNMNNIPLPPLKLKNSSKITNIIPQNIIRRFSNILGVNDARATELFKLGARSIEDLVENYKQYKLNRRELNGCLYFNNLLTEITKQDELDWTHFLTNFIFLLDTHIISSYITSRPDGIHSRIETLICVTGNCSECMDDLVDSLIDHFPYDPDMNILEIDSDGKANGKHSRIKCVLKNEVNGVDKIAINDITVYSIIYHPFPLLREYRSDIEELGYALNDKGFYDKCGNLLSLRTFIGRDNPSSIDDIKDYIEKIECI